MPPRAVALAALAGSLLALAFPAVDLNGIAWLGLVPLLFALRGRTVSEGFRLGGVTGIACFGGTIYWITNSIHLYGHLPLVVASVITLLLCAYCSLYPALFGAAMVFIRQRRPRLLLLAAPVIWTALEFARTHVISGFPWSLLGYTQYRSLPVIQVADITGVYGISFLVVLANTAVFLAIDSRKDLVPLVAAAAALGAALGYGALRLSAPAGEDSLRVAVIQGNIDQDRKWDRAFRSEVIDTFERLTLSVLPGDPDLVIWPETATPFYFGGVDDPHPALTDGLRRFVRRSGTPLLFGSPTYEKRGRRYFLKNSAFLLDRDGTPASVYHKLHLVPFGEYIPLKSSLLFFVNKMVRAPGDFEPGTGHTVMTVRGKKDAVAMSTVICYEIIFPDLVRRFVKAGADVMTTITNDAWFGRTGAPYQHFSMAVFRAVENRVPVARAANTGISGFIDAQGHILASSDIFTEAALVRDIAPSGGTRTLYTRFGDVFAWICVAASVILLTFPLKDDQPRIHTDPHG
jgi:apolipoprotein N-acyltransferase